jgi:hypothetical protein
MATAVAERLSLQFILLVLGSMSKRMRRYGKDTIWRSIGFVMMNKRPQKKKGQRNLNTTGRLHGCQAETV